MLRLLKAYRPAGIYWWIHPADWPKYLAMLESRGQPLSLEPYAVRLPWDVAGMWDDVLGTDYGRRQVPITYRLRPGDFRRN